MRAIGGKPPVDPVPFTFAPTDSTWRTEKPETLTYTIEPILPPWVVGMSWRKAALVRQHLDSGQ